jgi:CO/xanthine dehydrogenase FAD-binding subunit
VEFVTATSWAEALAARAELPGAVPIAGGTDVMVELNFDRHRPEALLDLTRVPELREWSRDDGGGVRLGAGVSFARVMSEVAALAPGLAMASRTVGSPQIRVRGTVGGNLGSASPAGDAHPVLLAVGATVEVESLARGRRSIPVAEFFTGVKQSALEPDELIASVLMPPAGGPQQFAKVGTRNAMVIAVTSFGLALHPEQGRVGAAIGSAAPTPRHAPAAEEFAAGALADLWASRRPLPDGVAERFGELVASAAQPIDDVRGTADYRRHALSVLGRRTLHWAWQEYRTTTGRRPLS